MKRLAERIRQLTPFGEAARQRDFALTFLAEFAVIAGGLLVYWLAARAFTTDGFGVYVLARRTLSLIQLPLLLGLGLSVTRFIAMAGEDASVEGSMIAAASVVSGVMAIGAVVVVVLTARPLAYVLMGGVELAPIMVAMVPAFPGIMMHSLAYGILRGRLKMAPANALQLLNLGIIPAAAFAVSGDSVVRVLLATGGAWCLTSGAVMVAVVRRIPRGSWRRDRVSQAGRTLLGYGLPRIPGEIAFGTFLTLPVTLAAHIDGTAAAGFVGLGVAMMNMIGSLFAPIGHIVLPAATSRFAAGDRAGVRRESLRLTVGITASAAVLVAIAEALMPLVIRVYLGDAFVTGTDLVRLTFAASVPFALWVSLRNILDAVHVRPHNAKNIIIALGLFAIVGLTASSVERVAAGFVAAVCLLGVLSVIDARRLLADVPHA